MRISPRETSTIVAAIIAAVVFHVIVELSSNKGLAKPLAWLLGGSAAVLIGGILARLWGAYDRYRNGS